MRKKLYEDVETVYKVTIVIFPDVEETEEFDRKEDAMGYAQEQISSGNYDEVIVSEVTIDEDGYEEETILLDEQGESKSNVYYALHTFYEDEPDEIDIDSLETFDSEEEAMKRAKELEAKGLRVVINIEGDESAGWDPEDYDYSDIGDEIYSTPYTMEEDVKSNKKMRTEEDWENELEDDNSKIFDIMNSLQSVLDTVDYPEPEMIYSYMDEIYDLFIQGDDKELDHVIKEAKSIVKKYLLEENFKSKDKYSVLREALDKLDKVYSNKSLKESPVYNYIVRYDGWVEPLYITSLNPFDLGKKKDAYKFNSFDDAFNAWEELCKDPKFRDSIINDTDRTIFKLREALDRLDREDSRGKKTKSRAQIRNLRSKLK